LDSCEADVVFTKHWSCLSIEDASAHSDGSVDEEKDHHLDLDDYSIHLSKLNLSSDGGRNQFAKVSPSDLDLPSSPPVLSPIPSVDDGPEDFTINLAKYVNGELEPPPGRQAHPAEHSPSHKTPGEEMASMRKYSISPSLHGSRGEADTKRAGTIDGEELMKLKEELASCSAEKELLHKEAQTLRNQIAQMRQERDSFRDENLRLESEHASLSSQFERLKNRDLEVKEDIADLEKENSDLKWQVSSVQTESAKARLRITKLEADNDTLKTALQKATAKHRAAERESKARLSELEAQISQATSDATPAASKARLEAERLSAEDHSASAAEMARPQSQSSPAAARHSQAALSEAEERIAELDARLLSMEADLAHVEEQNAALRNSNLQSAKRIEWLEAESAERAERMQQAADAREDEWFSRMDKVFAERDVMARVLMRLWGEKEVGEVGIGGEKGVGYRYKYMQRPPKGKHVPGARADPRRGLGQPQPLFPRRKE
jgi:hypothetical protein